MPREQLAPGLAVYRLPKPPTAAGPIELVDQAGAVRATAQLDLTRRAALPAPSVRKVTFSQSRKGRSTLTQVSVTLGRAPPPGALALVLTDAAGVARSWGKPTGGLVVHVLDQGRCQALPHATVETAAREKVRLFWVDALGRRSPASRTFTVGR